VVIADYDGAVCGRPATPLCRTTGALPSTPDGSLAAWLNWPSSGISCRRSGENARNNLRHETGPPREPWQAGGDPAEIPQDLDADGIGAAGMLMSLQLAQRDLSKSL
jgi:hypothetical protein